MESEATAEELLRAAERAEAAPWVELPTTPAWYPPAVGLWAGALTLALGLLDGVARSLALVVLVGAELGFLAWYRRYRGTMPTGWAPRELRPVLLLFVVGLAVVAGLALVLCLVGQPVTAAVAVLVLTTPLVWWYERAYAAAAAATRARLG
ncbi:hypothetical protein G5V58_08730 [Nocardioides anomalus]|uniref:Uncharacterized protein n=1 Tax=Nocardioides anomalus TaxID=2712223 RepID=A0A6G6WCG6_9ACTN|nr:hypothetical protein [Nocardioides anomalus]QIG42843.1 hypothetical protein G5V58_08730 [Nocardioides anomalus]